MNVDDAHWLATSGMSATSGFAFLADPLLEDAEAAFADGDWATTIECVAETLERLGYCEAALHGYAGDRSEFEVLPALTRYEGISTARFEHVPSVADATRATAERALVDLRAVHAEVRGMLPIELPAMRTPGGFFPALGVAKNLAQLRDAVGLEPFRWEWFL